MCENFSMIGAIIKKIPKFSDDPLKYDPCEKRIGPCEIRFDLYENRIGLCENRIIDHCIIETISCILVCSICQELLASG